MSKTSQKNEIYQAIKQLALEIDHVLHNILRDSIVKYLKGKEQILYQVDSANSDDYWQLQKNHKTIGWVNLLQGKFSKDWRKLLCNYTKKKAEIRKRNDLTQPKLRTTSR